MSDITFEILKANIFISLGEYKKAYIDLFDKKEVSYTNNQYINKGISDYILLKDVIEK